MPLDNQLEIRQVPDMNDPSVRESVDQNAAKYWVQEYQQAMAGDKHAQQQVRDVLQGWSKLPENSPGQAIEADIINKMYRIDPKAADAFYNAAVVKHDGSIQFRK